MAAVPSTSPQAPKPESLDSLLARVRACNACAATLPLGPRPVLAAHEDARILIVGQAPGTRVHQTGIPWNDPSGDRLRGWMGIGREVFYDRTKVAIVPMGFCYPGRGGGGDLPPRPECAPAWHAAILDRLPNLELTILAGRFAVDYYLRPKLCDVPPRAPLSDMVARWRHTAPELFPLPHPSPRNRLWFKRHAWFESELVPALRARVAEVLG